MKILIFATLLFFLFATPARAQVVISEVYPAPTSEEKEWIELYNSSEETIDISGWKLFDYFSSKSELVTFSEVEIDPYGFYVFELPSNKLNNSEEKVVLENPDLQEISSLYYTNSQSQKSFAYLFTDQTTIGNNLQISQPTKGIINPVQPPATSTPPPTPSPTPVSTITPAISPGPTPESPQFGTTGEVLGLKDQAMMEKEIVTSPKINRQLELHRKINSQLKIPKLNLITKEGLENRIPKFSYLVQKKISKEGVIGAIIGGTLLLFTGLLL